jgi:hypothetical protein
MAQISPKLRVAQRGRVAFWCPACNGPHVIRAAEFGAAPPGPIWAYNDDPHKPTFSPSVKVTGIQDLTEDEYARIVAGEKVETRPRDCHRCLTLGIIQYLGDCTHAMAGQTVEMPDWPASAPDEDF